MVAGIQSADSTEERTNREIESIALRTIQLFFSIQSVKILGQEWPKSAAPSLSQTAWRVVTVTSATQWAIRWNDCLGVTSSHSSHHHHHHIHSHNTAGLRVSIRFLPVSLYTGNRKCYKTRVQECCRGWCNCSSYSPFTCNLMALRKKTMPSSFKYYAKM